MLHLCDKKDRPTNSAIAPNKFPVEDPKYAVWDIAPRTELPGRNHQPLFNEKGWYRDPFNEPKFEGTKYTDISKNWTVGFKTLAKDFFMSDYFAKLV